MSLKNVVIRYTSFDLPHQCLMRMPLLDEVLHLPFLHLDQSRSYQFLYHIFLSGNRYIHKQMLVNLVMLRLLNLYKLRIESLAL